MSVCLEQDTHYTKLHSHYVMLHYTHTTHDTTHYTLLYTTHYSTPHTTHTTHYPNQALFGRAKNMGTVGSTTTAPVPVPVK